MALFPKCEPVLSSSCVFKYTRTTGMLEHINCSVINGLYRYGINYSQTWPTLERVDAGSGGGLCVERHCRTQNRFQSRHLAFLRLRENPSRQKPQLLTGYAVAHLFIYFLINHHSLINAVSLRDHLWLQPLSFAEKRDLYKVPQFLLQNS